MGLHGITELIDAVDRGIGGGIEADAVVGTADIIINGGRNADHIDAVFGKRPSTAESTVAADGDDAVQAQEFAGGNSLFLTFLCHKFLAAGGVQNRAAAVNGMSNALFIQPDHVAVDQAVITSADTVALQAVVKSSTDNCTDSCVHTRGVATTGQNANSFYLHMYSSVAWFLK